jgi:hypothetical protein
MALFAFLAVQQGRRVDNGHVIVDHDDIHDDEYHRWAVSLEIPFDVDHITDFKLSKERMVRRKLDIGAVNDDQCSIDSLYFAI